MHWIDWAIIAAVLGFIGFQAYYTQRYTKSVADFLAGGRVAGRYMLTVSEGMAIIGAISFIAAFEMYYRAGFPAMWWSLVYGPVGLFIALSGWVIYRFRQTRAMTLAQFFEMRYSRKFRIFTGILAWAAGTINFGIFPAVSARFFIHFCSLPATIPLAGFEISTYMLLMVILLGLSLALVLFGGQITIMFTDFWQGIFVNTVVVAMVMYLLCMRFDWGVITEAISSAPTGKSMVNPMDTGNVGDFNIWYFVIAALSMFYVQMAWQGTQGFNCAARTPHEARMGKVLGNWRGIGITAVFAMLPICAYTFMHHPNFAGGAAVAQAELARIDNSYLRDQAAVTIVLRHILPVGFVGAFAAVMFMAFIGCNSAYLHSWGSIFIQDVVMQFRKEPFSPSQHLRYLRLSILFVGIFTFFFSLWYPQTQPIFMFMAVTGALFLGGAGTVIIGGIYWKFGTTRAAWSAMFVGCGLAFIGMVLPYLWPAFPLNGQWVYAVSMAVAATIYVAVSLLGPRQIFDMDKLLHRGRYAISADSGVVTAEQPSRGLKALGITNEFTRGDKVIYFGTLVWSLSWFAVFVVGTIYGLLYHPSDAFWNRIWFTFIWICLIVGVIVTLWLLIGGLIDTRYMLNVLRSAKRDNLDDGRVMDKTQPVEGKQHKESSKKG